MRQTKMANGKDIIKNWYIVDASELILGRMSTEVAKLLTGKNKPTYTPQEDNGDFVIVINANKVVLTGKKLNKNNGKKYYNYSGYHGGMRIRSAHTMKKNYSVELVKKSIWGMMSHNKLGRKQFKKLFVYDGLNHEHKAQKPIIFEIKNTKAERGKK